MKIFFSFILLFMNSQVFACPDFSGTFKTDDNAIYSITQIDCERMDMLDSGNATTIVFDGKEQLIYSYDVEDGHINVFITSEMTAAKWIYNERAIKLNQDGNVVESPSWSEVFLNLDTNLVTVKHFPDGSSHSYIDKRN